MPQPREKPQTPIPGQARWRTCIYILEYISICMHIVCVCLAPASVAPAAPSEPAGMHIDPVALAANDVVVDSAIDER